VLKVDVAGLKVDVAVLKTDVGYIKRDLSEVKHDVSDLSKIHERDFRVLFGALVVVALGLSGLMAKGFGWLH
jgi:hypothetical protein